MSRRFADQVVWITGGGSGIGLAMAEEFARQGASVIVSGRREERLADALTRVEAVGGARGLAIPCDVTDEDQIQTAVARILKTYGRLDVTVANAGFAVAGRMESLTAEDLRRQLDVNVVGAAMTAKYSLPPLRETGGRLVLMASVASMAFYPGGGAYTASKAALRAMGQVLSLELHGSGVSCTTLHPGFVESEIAQVDNTGVFHAERNDPRPQRFMWPADRAARVMLRAIARRDREFVFTGHGRIAAWVGRHMPGLIHFAVTRGPGSSKAKDYAKARQVNT